jgi:hypothetical protein
MKTIIFASLVFISFVCVNAQTKADVDCVRSVPEPILSKKYFPTATFSLTKNKENPSEQIGTEKIKLNKNTSLTIKNWGCENYTLTFRYELNKFSHKLEDTKFWYKKAIELMKQIKSGIRSADKSLIERGTNALSSYIKKTKKPKFETDISFGGKEIRDIVIVNKARKQGQKYQLEVTFSVGHL